MTNTRAQEKEAKKLMEHKEGSIASRLRSRLKLEGADSNTRNTEKKSQTVTVRKNNNNSVEEKTKNGSAKKKGFAAPRRCKTTFASKKVTSTSRKEPSKVTISHDVGKKKEKATPMQQKLNPNPIYYIKYKGFEERHSHWSCDLCEEYLTGFEEIQLPWNFNYYGEEDLVSVLPEVAILPCTHVFHSTCLSTLDSANVSDPMCPICISMLSI